MVEISAERTGDTIVVHQDGAPILMLDVDLARQFGLLLLKSASLSADAIDDVEAAANG